MKLVTALQAMLAVVSARAVHSPAIAPADNAPSPRDRLPFARNRKPVVAAKGFIDLRQRAGTKRIAITFDDGLFTRVKACADAEHVSFAEAARRLIERGLTQPPK